MKAFLLGVAFSVGLAVLSGFAMQDLFSRPADETFASPSVRVGDDGSIAARGFSGEAR
ncbi:hypothetical protein [Arenibaculum pallidiluteum]|uniref:hypothetical protein n=1 Tax=Arenibaculum pallidiluteum TaxID=2812559 RepID=UPI001A978653|nr:hypothetical protein [Arenibaculum pallidiluteum]